MNSHRLFDNPVYYRCLCGNTYSTHDALTKHIDEETVKPTFLYVRLEVPGKLAPEEEIRVLNCVRDCNAMIEAALYLDLSPLEQTHPDAFAKLSAPRARRP